MTQWIATILSRNGSHRTVACLRTERLVLHVMKVPSVRRLPPFVVTLDLANSPQGGKTRLAEIRGDTPQACTSLLGQLLAIATQELPATAGSPANRQ